MMKKELIEIFLFIDPLGHQCFKARNTISHFTKCCEAKISIRIVPMVNIRKIKEAVACGKYIKEGTPLERQNKLYMNTYHAALAYNAAAMQGKQKGHLLLSALQELVVYMGEHFSLDLLMDTVSKLDIDLEVFQEDFYSDFARQCFQRDQKLAAEMNIKNTPSCVIIKTSDTEGAYRLDEKIEENILQRIIDAEPPRKETLSHLYINH